MKADERFTTRNESRKVSVLTAPADPTLAEKAVKEFADPLDKDRVTTDMSSFDIVQAIPTVFD
jgi:hypothetical protein